MPLLAKSPSSAHPQGQTLLEHTYAVLARLRDVASLRPDLPQRVGFPRLWDVLTRAALIHDFGKAARGFQAVLMGKTQRWPYRHEVLSLAFVPWVAQGLSDEEHTLLAATVVTHHKDLPEIADDYLRETNPEDDPLAAMTAELDLAEIHTLYTSLTEALPQWWQNLQWPALGLAAPPPLLPWHQAQTTLTPAIIRAQLQRAAAWLETWEDRLYDAEDPLREAATARIGVFLRGFLVQSDHLGSAEVGPPPHPRWETQSILQAAHIPRGALYPTNGRPRRPPDTPCWLPPPEAEKPRPPCSGPPISDPRDCSIPCPTRRV